MICPDCNNTGMRGMSFCSCSSGDRKRAAAGGGAKTWASASVVDEALREASQEVERTAAKFGSLRVGLNRQCGEDDVAKAKKILQLASQLLAAMEWRPL